MVRVLLLITALVITGGMLPYLSWWEATLYGFGAVYGTAVLGLLFYVLATWFNWLPISWQRPLYESTKQRLIEEHPGKSLGLYFLELDQDFESGGYRTASLKLLERFDTL